MRKDLLPSAMLPSTYCNSRVPGFLQHLRLSIFPASELRKYQEFEEVDQMLATDHHLTSVLLGALLDCAAGRCDAKRADELWEKLVTSGKAGKNTGLLPMTSSGACG